MQSFQAMRMDQRKADLQDLQCIHSKAMGTFYPDWEDHWIVNDVEATDLSYRVYCNPDIRVQTLLDEGMFLSAIQTEGDVTLLFTVKRKHKYPLCSNINCSKQTKRIGQKMRTLITIGTKVPDQSLL